MDARFSGGQAEPLLDERALELINFILKHPEELRNRKERPLAALPKFSESRHTW